MEPVRNGIGLAATWLLTIAGIVLALASPARAQGQRYAVVVGIGAYEDPKIPSLAFAGADARAVADLLGAPQTGGTPAHVKVLTDAEATKKAILSALGTWLPRAAGRDDTVLIYYAGHGAPELDPTGRAADGFTKYLVPYDAEAGDLFATAIPMRDLEGVFARIEAGRIVIVLDTCYSGAAGGRTFYAGPTGRALNITGDFLDRIAQGEGRIVITSADANEVALELPELGHGLFTHFFLEALRGGADRDLNGTVTVDEAYPYIYDHVVEASRASGGSQHPILAGSAKGPIAMALTTVEGAMSLRASDPRSLGRIQVEVDAPAVQVTLDDQTVWVSSPVEMRHEWVVPEGPHRLLARMPGASREYERAVHVGAGGAQNFVFGFDRGVDPVGRRTSMWGRALLGLGGVGALTSAGYVGYGYLQVTRREVLTQRQAQDAREDFSRVRSWGLVGGAVAGVVVGTGTFLWWKGLEPLRPVALVPLRTDQRGSTWRIGFSADF